MNEGWFGKVQTCCYVTCHAEIWILVDGAGDEGWDEMGLRLIRAENVWEGGCKSRCALDGSEVHLADVGAYGC